MFVFCASLQVMWPASSTITSSVEIIKIWHGIDAMQSSIFGKIWPLDRVMNSFIAYQFIQSSPY